MNKEKALLELGLTENEIKAYLTLLRLGGTKGGRLAEEVGMNRSLIYRVLDSLIKKNLASSVIKENITYYSATSPNNLKKLLAEKQENLEAILPELLAIKPQEKEGMVVEVYSDLKGIKTVLRDQLERAKEFYVLGAGNEFASLTEHFYDQYYTIRIERKIKQKILFKSEAKDRAIKVARSPYSEVKVLDPSYKMPLAIVIYEDNVAFISWPNKKVVLIRSKTVSRGFIEQFNILWKLSEDIDRDKRSRD